jgi:predicted O-linked N-acetylglucosamine transferase (SPINDLY family)
VQVIQQAIALHQQGKFADAERLYREVLRSRPRDFDALHMLGVLQYQQGRVQDALPLLEAAIAVDARSAAAHINRGLALASLRRNPEALAAFDAALAIAPRNADALASRGDTLCDLGRRDEALASYDRAIAIDPRHVAALVNRGLALRDLGRPAEALASYDAAVAVAPEDAEAWNNRGVALTDLGSVEDALNSYERALALWPDYVDALLNRASTLLALRRPADAIASYARALALRGDLAQAHGGRGHACYDLGRFVEALAHYEKALVVGPGDFDAAVGRARTLCKLDRYQEALAEYERLYALRPDFPNLLGDLAHCRATVCQWLDGAALERRLVAEAVAGRAAVDPFMVLSFGSTEEEQLACAQSWLRHRKVMAAERTWDRRGLSGDKIRVAYLSADFHRHATAHLIAELLERHDRSRFEIIGVSFGPDDKSPLRSRLIKSFDRFFDVTAKSDRDTAKLLRDLNTHIAVDLKGFTTDARIGILAERAAPIQVSYLGYPGTTGASFIDYVIADPVVLPFARQPVYTERIVHLPDSYQVNDSKRSTGEGHAPRRDQGLPEGGFVFCCFNNMPKLNARMFDIWMRLLKAVEASVLWLYAPNDLAPVNLRREAQSRGVDPARLVFARPADLPDHLARHRLADLFLDTLPYNAHTTASDSLWAGVPLVTCRGETFAGRVAASLLHAVGLPELVAENLEAYEALALSLATDPARLRAIRSRLEQQRLTLPLFDCDRFRRNIESAYATMWDIWQRGEPPRGFAVSAR